jgi:hypothetical protein
VIKQSANGDNMKYTQKTKYFIYGVIATAVLLPLGTYAVKTIPVTFAEGDVLSASVMNSLMTRINDVQQGFTSNQEILGTYSCKTITAESICALPFDAVSGSTKKTKTQNITFSCNGDTCSWTAASFFPGSCSNDFTGGRTLTQTYEILNHWMVMPNSVSPIQKTSPTSFNWYISGQTLPNAFAECTKTSQPPAPADAITATVSGTSVALAWTDQSVDETGFKVQYKTSAKGSWTTATTTAANATSYTISSLTAGKYWIRVIAKNSDGDAMSSSEIQAEVQ